MRLLEWQAKQLFLENNIQVPGSVLVTKPADLRGSAYPAVMKAQVPIGGRGKVGAIKLVENLAEAETELERILALNVRGFIPQAVLLEQPVQSEHELYISILFDKQKNAPVIIASPVGGMDIEKVAEEMPEKIIRVPVDHFLGIQPFMIRYLAKYLGTADQKGLEQVVKGMYQIFSSCDARLVEINPLVEVKGGFLALDAKIELDDHAADRHAQLFDRLRKEHTYTLAQEITLPESMAKQYGVKYVYLGGDVGIITDGAGTGMLALDLVSDEGGRPANFCELGGFANPEMVCNAIKVVLSNPNVKVLLITLIGGLTRMDEMAEGIALYIRENDQTVPFVVRMCGTKEEEGIALLKEVGLSAHNDINVAVREAVGLTTREKHGNIN